MFVKLFFVQKSKPSSNLNHKEGKQEEATTNKSTTISGSWVKNKSRVIYPWNSFLGEGEGGQFSSGNYEGNKLSVFLGSNFQGDIVTGQLSLRQLSGSNNPEAII